MKKLIVLIAILFAFSACQAWGEEDKKGDQPVSKCGKLPIYGKLDDCLKCHIAPSMKLKEEDPHLWRAYPRPGMWIYTDAKGDYGYFAFIDDVDHNYTGKHFFDFFKYLEHHKITRAVIEIQSFGGSVFEAWRIVGIIQEAQANGVDVITKLQSIAASAGAILFLTGNNRLISPTAELMFHELWTFKMLSIESPADKEDEARVLRHIQDTITDWIASRSNLSREDINERIRKKEFWVRGTQAMEYGFATGFIGK